MSEKVIYIQGTDGEGGIKTIAKVTLYERGYLENKKKNPSKHQEKYPVSESWDDITFDVEIIDVPVSDLGTIKIEIISYINEAIKTPPRKLPDTIYLNYYDVYVEEYVEFNVKDHVVIGAKSMVFGNKKHPTLLNNRCEINEDSTIQPGSTISHDTVIFKSEVGPNTFIENNVEMDKSHTGQFCKVGHHAYMVNKILPSYCEIPAYFNAFKHEVKPGDKVKVIKKTNNYEVVHAEGIFKRIGTGEHYVIGFSNGEEVGFDMREIILKKIGIDHKNYPDFLYKIFEQHIYSDADLFKKYSKAN